MDPSDSVPSEIGAKPAATADAEPDEEPQGELCPKVLSPGANPPST